MDLPGEAGLVPQAVPSHQQHQADTRQVPHKQQRQESVIHLILYSSFNSALGGPHSWG